MTREFNSKTIKLIIGLGNSDPSYEKTYHNIGSAATDYLKNELSQASLKNTQRGPFMFIKTKKYIFVRSKTFMNKSGVAVKSALAHFRAKTHELLVIHDDSDLTLGTYKLNFGRGSAGHHGIESIFETIKTKNFWRLRIGIRENKNQTKRAANFVLKKISATHQKIIQEVFKRINQQLM